MSREQKKVDHTNIFDSWLAQDVFVYDILEKIANDWKKQTEWNSIEKILQTL